MKSSEKSEFSHDEIRTLQASALFSHFSSAETTGLLQVLGARRKTFPDGAVVTNEQEPPTQMGILLSGNLHVYDSAFKGRRHLVRIVRPGGVLGATLLGTRQKGCPALVTASGECVLAVVSLSEVDKLLKSGGGAFYRNLLSVAHEELLASWRKIALLSCTRIDERVLLYLRDRSRLENSKTFAIGSTEGEFADFLGVSRCALARTLRRLAKEGHFSYVRDVFTLS